MRTEEGVIAPVEGCPEDGPTVCLEASDPGMEARLSAYAEAEASGETAAVREAASSVSAAYAYHRLYRVLFDLYDRHVEDERYRTPIRLSVDGALPFEVLAKTMATVARRAWDDYGYESAVEMFEDGGRGRPMFDVIYLDVRE